MADAISNTVKHLLHNGLADAAGQEMACETATYDEVVERVETLLLDLCEERGDLSFALLVMTLGAMRLQILLAEMTNTMDEKLMRHFIYKAAQKTASTGQPVGTMVELINIALDEHNRPKPPPEVR